MKMLTVNLIKEVQTLEDLEDLGIGEVIYSISHRGGNLGFYGKDIAAAFAIAENYLPDKYGCYCNYLGGGIRGCLIASGFYKAIKPAKAGKLIALAEACKRVYLHIESEAEIPDDVMTGYCRVQQKSAY